MTQLVIAALAAVVRGVVNDLLRGCSTVIAHYLLATPDPARSAALRQVWEAGLAALGVLAVLAVALAATTTIPAVGPRAAALREAVGTRLVLGLVSAAVTLPLIAAEVRLADALVGVELPAAAGAARLPAVTALIGAATGSGGAELGGLAVAVTGSALAVLLAIAALARWAVLWLLIALAPLVQAAGLFPGGLPLVRLWWRLQLGTVLLPVAQAALLAADAALFGGAGGLTPALAGAAVLALAARLPLWAAGQAVHLTPRDIGAPWRPLTPRYSWRPAPAGRRESS